MGAQKEDVQKFLDGNPEFAKTYFAKKLDQASISMVTKVPLKQVDFSLFEELSQVRSHAAATQRNISDTKNLTLTCSLSVLTFFLCLK